MKSQLFKLLTKSMKQAGAIARGERKPSRKFEYTHSRVQAVRDALETAVRLAVEKVVSRIVMPTGVCVAYIQIDYDRY
jgi:hypothetical protein